MSPPDMRRIYIAGDSLAATRSVSYLPMAGWGQALPLFLAEGWEVVNCARGRASSKSFYDRGRWQWILDQLQPGDYAFISFGRIDTRPTPGMHTSPFGTYLDYLHAYVESTRSRQAHPVLISNYEARHLDRNGNNKRTLLDYPAAMEVVANQSLTPYVDLYGQSLAWWDELGPERTRPLFTNLAPDEQPLATMSRTDNTHLRIAGAVECARFIARSLLQQKVLPSSAVTNLDRVDFSLAEMGWISHRLYQQRIETRVALPAPRAPSHHLPLLVPHHGGKGARPRAGAPVGGLHSQGETAIPTACNSAGPGLYMPVRPRRTRYLQQMRQYTWATLTVAAWWRDAGKRAAAVWQWLNQRRARVGRPWGRGNAAPAFPPTSPEPSNVSNPMGTPSQTALSPRSAQQAPTLRLIVSPSSVGYLDLLAHNPPYACLTKVSPAGDGKVRANPQGGVTYTPRAGRLGYDTFSYEVVLNNGPRCIGHVWIYVGDTTPAPGVLCSSDAARPAATQYEPWLSASFTGELPWPVAEITYPPAVFSFPELGTPISQLPRIAGTAEPGETRVVLEVDGEEHATVKVNSKGKWWHNPTAAWSPGQHEISATVWGPNGRSRRSKITCQVLTADLPTEHPRHTHEGSNLDGRGA